MPHTEILKKTSCRSIEAMITLRQLQWLGHVIRMPPCRLPHRVLYGQLHHGRRSAGGPKKRYKDQMKNALKTCKIRPEDLEEVAADRNIWQKLCRDGVHMLEMERTTIRQQKQARRNTAMAATTATTTTIILYIHIIHHYTYICPTCNRVCGSRIGLFSHQRSHR